MSTQDNGGPAFPVQNIECAEPKTKDAMKAMACGMSLRDYFAAKAMQAAATNPTGAEGFTFSQRSEWAYEQADAMLKARQS